ncbi:hypothetical protein chiPu_0018226, partial [Chiloscyllium punctatum]|nr:hypothetical protein [Chiloscyllium punctatum]
KDRLGRLVVTPLATLHVLFSTPQKLIQKRYDKLLDYVSCLKQSESVRDKREAEELNEAKKDYEALNGQLVEELQKFNKAAKKILINCIFCFMAVFRDLMSSALQASPPVKTILAPQQTEDVRARLLATHSPDKLFQAKRKFNAAQDLDASLHEGEIVAVLEKQDPLGSVNRWLIDTGVMQGYVYSSFLRPYNPATGQNGVSTDGSALDEDFDDISLFVSSSCGDTNNARSMHFNANDGENPLLNSQEVSTPETSSINGNDDTSSDLEDHQIFYAVYPFEARSKHELSLQEYERVTIVKSSDLSGNPDWWLAERHSTQKW